MDHGKEATDGVRKGRRIPIWPGERQRVPNLRVRHWLFCDERATGIQDRRNVEPGEPLPAERRVAIGVSIEGGLDGGTQPDGIASRDEVDRCPKEGDPDRLPVFHERAEGVRFEAFEP